MSPRSAILYPLFTFHEDDLAPANYYVYDRNLKRWVDCKTIDRRAAPSTTSRNRKTTIFLTTAT